jgi:hypothetical protein
MFEPYPKIARLAGATMSVTEKIDGTNGLIVVAQENPRHPEDTDLRVTCIGSRKRAIEPDIPRMVDHDTGRTIQKRECRDNYGFAAWVRANESALVEFLGEGYHYGEWAGPGIQKNPLGLDERTFFLFHWHRHPPEKFEAFRTGDGLGVPDQLATVPVLVEKAPFSLKHIAVALEAVLHRSYVDAASLGQAEPIPGEGLIISAFGTKLKLTADNRPKGVHP